MFNFFGHSLINLYYFTLSYLIIVQDRKFTKIDKHAGRTMAMQAEVFKDINEINTT